MGVNDLWYILHDICERKPLTYLTGKKVAVDLSGWVVEAVQCQGLNRSRNPHLKNLFFRVSRLLQLGVFPIFVMDGRPPSVKNAVMKTRNVFRHSGNKSSFNISRNSFDEILRECQDLLNCLGVPCVKSSGEGEAFCAFLFLNGIVSGVITEDSDAFLYGADVVYRDFSIIENDSHVNVYCLKSEKNKLKLDRQKLVALALLLGCDYSKGVPGIGKETATKLLLELQCDNILQRFKDWKNLSEADLFPGLNNKNIRKSIHCNRCGHIGSSAKHKKEGCSGCDSEFTCYLEDHLKPCQCPWHIQSELMAKWKTELKIYNAAKNCPDFPNLKVIEEYLNYQDKIPSDDSLIWSVPNVSLFQEKTFNYLGWTMEYSNEKILPLITSWQQFQINSGCSDKNDFIVEPEQILKERTIRGEDLYEVQWKVLNEDIKISTDNLVTVEYCDRFTSSYKDVVTEFLTLKAEMNEKKQSNGKRKRLKPPEGNLKMTDFFAPKNKCQNSDISMIVEEPFDSSVKSTVDSLILNVPSPKRVSHKSVVI